MLHTLVKSSAFHGALVGWLTAAAVDYHAFRTWKSVQDVLTYNWGTAALRWAQGAVVGAVGNTGLGALLG